MYFYKTIYGNKIVLTLNLEFIDDVVCEKILAVSRGDEKIGIDMKNVSEIKSQKFINCLLSDKFGLFNLKNEILIYLSLILKDGFLKSYMNIDDFDKNKRELIRRHFLVA